MKNQDLTKVKWGVGALVAAVAAWFFWSKTAHAQPAPINQITNKQLDEVARTKAANEILRQYGVSANLASMSPGWGPTRDYAKATNALQGTSYRIDGLMDRPLLDSLAQFTGFAFPKMTLTTLPPGPPYLGN